MALRFEGVGDNGADTGGNGYLEYVFLDQDNHELGSGGRVYLELLNIKHMYERGKATPDDMDASGYVDGYPKPYEFLPQQPTLRDVFCEDDPNGYNYVFPWDEDVSQCLIYVHGWSVDYASCQNEAQTMYKRLWHRGYKGRFACFRWPCFMKNDLSDAAFDFTYNSSEYRAWKYGPALKQFIARLRGEMPQAAMNVAAHSQGNVVTAAALMPSSTVYGEPVAPAAIDNYVLMHAALSAHCYDPDVADEERFTHQEYTYFSFLGLDYKRSTPQTLEEGGYAGRLGGVQGHLINFYDKADDALAKWADDNELLKPVVKSIKTKDDSIDVYKFDRDVSVTSAQSQLVAQTAFRSVPDVHERMAFIARSLSYSVGQRGETGGPVSHVDAYDLEPLLDKLHSGERELPFQRVYQIYDRLLQATGNDLIQESK